MSRYYRRVEPGSRENLRAGLVAGALAGSVAVVSFYLVRLFLSRETLEPLNSPVPRDESSGAPNQNEV